MTVPTTTDQGSRKRAAFKKRTSASRQHAVRGGSSEANRLAVAILEVLAGVHSPSEAASALKISLPRYYQLETRALEGLVKACEPKPLGKQPSERTRIASLEKELQRVQRECARQQALVRAARRGVGLSMMDSPKKGKASSTRDRKGRKRRRPTVRALKAAAALRKRIVTTEPSEVQQTEVETPLADQNQVGLKEGPPDTSC